jgi:hypothetical protein
MGFKLPAQASSGGRFEKLVELSAARQCYVMPLPPIGAKRIGGGKLIPMKMPFDRIVIRRGSGRAICFDCKSCHLAKSFPVGNKDHVPDHQIMELIRAGSDGVIAGLLIEASHVDLQMVFWLPWKHLMSRPASIPWDDERLIAIGSRDDLIDFDRIIAATIGKPAHEQMRA